MELSIVCVEYFIMTKVVEVILAVVVVHILAKAVSVLPSIYIVCTYFCILTVPYYCMSSEGMYYQSGINWSLFSTPNDHSLNNDPDQVHLIILGPRSEILVRVIVESYMHFYPI